MAAPASTSNYKQFCRILEAAPVMVILRGISAEDIEDVGRALVDGGVQLIEVTLNTPDASACLQILHQVFGAREDVMIGAGTVVSVEQLRSAKNLGARFIVSPSLLRPVLSASRAEGLVSIPGVLTMSEALSACDLGADFLKCFPADYGGPSYLGALSEVVSRPLFAVGGVTLENAREYLSVAAGVGIGSAVYHPGKSCEAIQRDTQAFMSHIRPSP
jgi:2-dehydro-3-deoxyphosphogalactonate aldolase